MQLAVVVLDVAKCYKALMLASIVPSKMLSRSSMCDLSSSYGQRHYRVSGRLRVSKFRIKCNYSHFRINTDSEWSSTAKSDIDVKGLTITVISARDLFE